MGNGQHRVALAAVFGRRRVVVFWNLMVGMTGASVGINWIDGCRVVVGVVLVGVTGVGMFEIGMVVVADVKMEVKETGAHLAVVVPAVGRMQSETSGTYCAHQQQAWARRRQ